jgi:predicted transcriptional regulator
MGPEEAWAESLAGRRSTGYTSGIKTAISLPDDVFEEAERLASRLKVSRSELYAKALQEFVRRHAPDAIKEAYDRVCEETQPEPVDFVRRAARKSLKRAEW